MSGSRRIPQSSGVLVIKKLTHSCHAQQVDEVLSYIVYLLLKYNFTRTYE